MNPRTASDIDAALHQAALLAGEFLRRQEDPEEPVVRYRNPADLRRELDLDLPREGRPLLEVIEACRPLLEKSVHTGSTRFLNQLFGGTDLAGVLGEWMTAVVNTSMYTYEVAPVMTLIELQLIERACAKFGFVDAEGKANGEGILSPGGSISNLMAVLAARNQAAAHVKRAGLRAEDRLALFMSEDAHYSIPRAASIAGLGTDAVRKVAVDELGRMRPAALEEAVLQARAEGRRPFFVVATCGTTVPGAFDPVREIAAVARRQGLWLHVDAAYGGAAIFSEEHRALLDGSELADTLSWNPHKMLGVPLSCSLLLVRERGLLVETNGLQADYLFHDDPEVSCDLGDLSIQCGRRVDALKLWLSWQAHGELGFEQRVDRQFALARAFRDRVLARDGFRLVRDPQSCNVCFHFVPPSLRKQSPGYDRDARLDVATTTLRERLRAEGRWFVNYATIDGVSTFRIVMSHPELEEVALDGLLDDLERLGADL